MASKGWMERHKRTPKFSTRKYLRCSQCGRSHAVYKALGICRLCVRKLAAAGLLPGLKKASW